MLFKGGFWFVFKKRGDCNINRNGKQGYITVDMQKTNSRNNHRYDNRRRNGKTYLFGSFLFCISAKKNIHYVSAVKRFAGYKVKNSYSFQDNAGKNFFYCPTEDLAYKGYRSNVYAVHEKLFQDAPQVGSFQNLTLKKIVTPTRKYFIIDHRGAASSEAKGAYNCQIAGQYSYRHNKRTNTLCFDGHVESVKTVIIEAQGVVYSYTRFDPLRKVTILPWFYELSSEVISEFFHSHSVKFWKLEKKRKSIWRCTLKKLIFQAFFAEKSQKWCRKMVLRHNKM